LAGALLPPAGVAGVVGVAVLPPAGVVGVELEVVVVWVTCAGVVSLPPLSCLSVKCELLLEPPPCLFGLSVELELPLPLPLFTFCVNLLPFELPPDVEGVCVDGACACGATPLLLLLLLLPPPPPACEEAGGVSPVGCGGGVLSPPLSASAGVVSDRATAHAQTAASLDGTEGMFKQSPIRRRLLSGQWATGHLFDTEDERLKPRNLRKTSGTCPNGSLDVPFSNGPQRGG
jgi:hypothetical protein